MEMVFLDEDPAGVKLCGQSAHFMTHVEYGLLGRGDLRCQVTAVALVPQPQRALKTRKKAGF